MRYIYPATSDDAWYEAYIDAVHSLGKKWPDPITKEQEAWCMEMADREAPRPDDAGLPPCQ
jgi:hypothetical protein